MSAATPGNMSDRFPDVSSGSNGDGRATVDAVGDGLGVGSTVGVGVAGIGVAGTGVAVAGGGVGVAGLGAYGA